MISRPRAPLVAALVVVAAAASASAQEPRPAEGGKRAPGYGPPSVLCWFAKRDPVNTFQYKVYGTAKAPYTPAVDAWLKLVHERYPDYQAYVRKLALVTGTPEETIRFKAHELISKELLVLTVAHYGIVPGGTGRRSILAEALPPTSARPQQPLPPMWPSPGWGGVPFGGPPSYSFPVPYPYPRPHP